MLTVDTLSSYPVFWHYNVPATSQSTLGVGYFFINFLQCGGRDVRDLRASGDSLSKSERVQACKKTWGKKRKNKTKKQACIEAAKGQ